jgi:uncharacterized MAPEG superfamily protein
MLVLRDTPAGAAAAGAVAYVAVLWAVERLAYPDDVAQVRSLVAFRPRARPSSGA